MSSRAARRLILPCGLLLVGIVAATPMRSRASDFDNDDCLDCHEGSEDDEVDPARFAQSVHGENACVDCHSDATPDHDDLDEPLAKADCLECHEHEVEVYSTGIHGRLRAEGERDASVCGFCEGGDVLRPLRDPGARAFPLNVPSLCGECHRQGERSAARNAASETQILQNYSMSIHGKGLLESGLIVSATCTSCHTAHGELPAKDPRSSVNSSHIVETCGACHYGIEERLRKSVHSAEVTETREALPGCIDCHSAHTIKRVEWSDFRFQIITQCGHCHEELIDTYFQTYHGKASKLGAGGTARCHDCHGSHDIQPPTEASSTLSEAHIVKTCRKCHAGANENFVQYLPHATHTDRERFPQLFYSFWFMTILLVGTIGLFGIHTVLWLTRSLVVLFREGRRGGIATGGEAGSRSYYRRFEPIDSVLHLMVILSFLSLAFTGMMLKYPDSGFFARSNLLLGGPAVTGIIHRIGALITFAYVGIHLWRVGGKLRRREITARGLFTREYSLLPQWRDFQEAGQHLLWFFGRGPKPRFGRWTYWEKFDYFAVFWGVAVIGLTGLMMWFPESTTLVLPGWMINVAAVIHSDEALLAAAFIFTVHFFNTHFRPEKFPMDPVIFTGRVPLDEFRDEHPGEYERLVRTGELNRHLVGPPARWLAISAWVFGLTFVSIGLVIIAAIVYSIVVA